MANWHSPALAAAAKEIGYDDTKTVILQLESLFVEWPTEESYENESYRKTFRERIPPMNDLLEEVKRVKEMLEEFRDTPLVFCHNDVNMTNMVYDEYTGTRC
jgi:thiamine kinase-like enzyme